MEKYYKEEIMPVITTSPLRSIVLISALSQDAFVDTDNTQLESHTMNIGTGWTTVSHSLGIGATPADTVIVGNQVQIINDGAGIVTNIGVSDATISTDWIPAVGNDNRNSLIFRFANSVNHLTINMREDNGDIRIVKYQSGSSTVLDTAAFSFTEGQNYNIKVVLNGSSITAFVNNVSVLSAVSTFLQTNQLFGVGRNTGSNATRLDNWLVTA